MDRKIRSRWFQIDEVSPRAGCEDVNDLNLMYKMTGHMTILIIQHKPRVIGLEPPTVGYGSMPFRTGFGSREKQRVRSPQRNQIRPVTVLITVQLNPSIAIITGQLEVVLELRTHDSLMVVGRGIDQVAELLFRRPAFG